MKYIVIGKNLEVTEALREKVIKKMSKLEKFFAKDTDVHITMSVVRNKQIVEVTIPFHGVVLRAEASNEDMYASIDKVIDILEGQIRRNKTRLAKQIKEGSPRAVFFESGQEPDEEHEFKLVRTKKFAIKPMTSEEAILQMNLIGHEFFMFSNAETKEVNVVYKRKDGNYGLIEPQF